MTSLPFLGAIEVCRLLSSCVYYYHHEVMWMVRGSWTNVPCVPRVKPFMEHLCGTQISLQQCGLAPRHRNNVPMFHQKQNLRKTDRRPLFIVLVILLTKNSWNIWNISHLSYNHAPFPCSTNSILSGTLWNIVEHFSYSAIQWPMALIRAR